jgi:hypothetical protein
MIAFENPGGVLWAASIIVASEVEFIVLQRKFIAIPAQSHYGISEP